MRGNAHPLGGKEFFETEKPALRSVPRRDPKDIITELEVTCAADVKLKEYRWLWENKIPQGELTIFCGMPDTGKSTVAIDIAARMTIKKEFPDGSPCAETVSVLMMTTEDGQDTTIVPRLIVAGANLERVYFASKMNVSQGEKRRQRMIALDTDMSIVEQYLKKNPQIGLVVLESIASYLGRAKKNEETDMRIILDGLRELMARRDCALIAIDHVNKNGSQAALHRLGGSTSYGAAPRAVWFFARDEEDPARRLMLPLKLNIVADSKKLGWEYSFRSVPLLIDGRKTDRGAIEWIGVTHKNAERAIEAQNDPEASKTRQAMDFYREKLADGPKLSHQLYTELDAMGISARTAKRAQQKLKTDAYQEGAKWWVVLPKEQVQ
jgi:putative DNA primase/helicase